MFKNILSWRIISGPVKLSKKIVLPGFDGLPLYDVTRFFIKGLWEGYLGSRASSISFNFFLAIFPSLLFLFTIIPFIPIQNFQQTLLDLIHDFVPETTYETIRETVEDIVIRPRGGLLSIGFLLTLYFSTTGIHSLMEAFNNTYHTIESRTWIKQRLISTLLVLIISVLLIISIGLMTFGTALLSLVLPAQLWHSTIYAFLIWSLKWLVVLLTLFFTISFVYYLAPAKKRQFRFISAGSTLATILAILTTLGFNYYVDNFARYNILYGSIGTLMIVLLWIYFNSFSLIIGFELNASILKAKQEEES
jgi:membrane protein